MVTTCLLFEDLKNINFVLQPAVCEKQNFTVVVPTKQLLKIPHNA